jgi:hypothetical protein
VSTTSAWLAEWHMGHVSMTAARRRGLIDVTGPARLVRVLSTLGLSQFHDVVRRTAPGRPISTVAERRR